MKEIMFSFFLWLPVAGTYAQTTLDECRRKAQEHYPLVRRYSLIERAKAYNIENASKGYLPQFAFSAKATYQSDVTELPLKIPNIDMKGIPKDQYLVMLELQQNVWDSGKIRIQKKQAAAEAEIERQNVNVEMYALNSRINRLFFGILLLDEQLKQNILLQEELKRNEQQITAYRKYGIANRSDLDAVSVELLNTRQKQMELSTLRAAYLKMLSLFVGEELLPKRF